MQALVFFCIHLFPHDDDQTSRGELLKFHDEDRTVEKFIEWNLREIGF